MRKLAIGIGILFLIALAMPALADGNGAVVGKDTPCGIYVGDYGGGIVASDSQYVINGNNWKLTCHGQIAAPFPVKAVKYNEDTTPAQACNLHNAGQTQVWETVITPSGQVTLTCHGKIV
jgi:hypothetical protein